MIDVLEQGASGEGDVSMDEGDEEDETLNDDVDNSADPSAKAQAIQKAKQKQIEIQREKKLQKRQLRESSGKSSDAPEEAPAKRSKQASPSLCQFKSALTYMSLGLHACGGSSVVVQAPGCCINCDWHDMLAQPTWQFHNLQPCRILKGKCHATRTTVRHHLGNSLRQRTLTSKTTQQECHWLRYNRFDLRALPKSGSCCTVMQHGSKGKQ